jgi:cysteine desulfurase/selenocysteine lyase
MDQATNTKPANLNIRKIRKDFPILKERIYGRRLVYFDNGATTQRPLPVMRAVMDYVTRNNGNPHRGAHIFAMSASEAYDTSKTVVKDFIGAKSEKEIIYTRNTSESLNLVARMGNVSSHLEKESYVPHME